MSTSRTVLAAFLAPWTAPVFIVAAAALMAEGVPFHDDVALLVPVSAICSYVALFVLGMPTLYGLRRVGWLNICAAAGAGALLGAFVFAALSTLYALRLGSPPGIGELLSGSLWAAWLGFIVALSYATIAGLPARCTHGGSRWKPGSP